MQNFFTSEESTIEYEAAERSRGTAYGVHGTSYSAGLDSLTQKKSVPIFNNNK